MTEALTINPLSTKDHFALGPRIVVLAVPIGTLELRKASFRLISNIAKSMVHGGPVLTLGDFGRNEISV
jgi:hypothetical protein